MQISSPLAMSVFSLPTLATGGKIIIMKKINLTNPKKPSQSIHTAVAAAVSPLAFSDLREQF
jgi:hypothetical protein